jgi:hypothetical protein
MTSQDAFIVRNKIAMVTVLIQRKQLQFNAK